MYTLYVMYIVMYGLTCTAYRKVPHLPRTINTDLLIDIHGQTIYLYVIFSPTDQKESLLEYRHFG